MLSRWSEHLLGGGFGLTSPPSARQPACSLKRVDSGRGQDRTLRGMTPLECAIDGSPYGQGHACRYERISERLNMPGRSIWSARAVRPAHGRSRPAAPLHAVRRRYQAYPGAARGTQPAGLRTPDRAPRRNSRPLERGPAIPHGRAQPARHHRYPLESVHLGEAVRQRKHAGLTVEPELLAHILPTDEYRRPKRQ